MSRTDSTSRVTPESVSASTAKTSTKEETTTAPSEQSKAIADAIEQMRAATSAIYQAFGKMGGASNEMARLKLVEGKARAQEVATSAESAISKKPLAYVGAAFAAGFLASRLLK